MHERKSIEEYLSLAAATALGIIVLAPLLALSYMGVVRILGSV